VPVRLPPLRERTDDIPLLVDHFMVSFEASGVRLTEAALNKLHAHPWPGNVRELENAIERALILRRRQDTIDADDITLHEVRDPDGATTQADGVTIPESGIVMDDVERDLILEALRKTEGNQSAAARLLGITRQTLIYRVRKHGIRSGKP
jgi:two-component system NtrC family response regulator